MYLLTASTNAVQTAHLLHADLAAVYLWSALCNRADHIYFHPVSFFFLLLLLLLFTRLISAVGDWMSTILPNMVWP